MKRLVGAAVVAIFLAMPVAVEAAPFPPRLNFAYDLAIGYWGREPAACASIDRQVVPPGSLGNPLVGAISGSATQVPADAPPGSVDCALWIDRAYAEPIIFDLLCAVMLHNVGHLLGMEPSADPTNVMNEDIPVPRLCAVKGRQSTRLYFLRMRFHLLQARSGARALRMRHQTRRELSSAAGRFWSLDG